MRVISKETNEPMEGITLPRNKAPESWSLVQNRTFGQHEKEPPLVVYVMCMMGLSVMHCEQNCSGW